MMLHYLVIISQSNKDRSVIGMLNRSESWLKRSTGMTECFSTELQRALSTCLGALQERASAA